MIDSSDLVGTWQFFRAGETLGPAFIHFTYTQAFDYLSDGEAHQVLRLWYSLEEPDLIRFRNRPGEEGWTCKVKFEDAALIISGDESDTVCIRADAADIPEWFTKELLKQK